jgi:hypothetical protein
MITHIPTPADYEDAGVSFLNLAWAGAIGLMLKLDDRDVEASSEDDEVPDGYWEAAQKPLGAALSLMQQGTEQLLKARIASVSPFLLISGYPSEWPGGCHANDTAFSEFKTIDAQDLIRAHNALITPRLDAAFQRDFEANRRLRNVIMHSVDRTTRITAKSILVSTLKAHDALCAPQSWISVRRQHLETNPDSIAYTPEHVEPTMVRELMKVLDIFEPREVQDFLGVDKRQRFYICYDCYMNSADFAGVLPRSAQLQPNEPASTTLHCFICGGNQTVERRPCTHAGCPGNVIHEDDVCLTCNESQQ